MAEVIFYHQERVDGGQRTGITVDGDAVLHGFVDGGSETNPMLAWYLDVSWKTDAPPVESNALSWLKQRDGEIREVILVAAQELSGGIDVDTFPWTRKQKTKIGTLRVSVSAMRRLTARDIGGHLKRFATADWDGLFPVLTGR